MCGICGFVNLDGGPADLALIERMAASIAHRGPDGQGTKLDGALALGHRRLAILDPSRGVQPMCNEERSVWITYNGEIYNFPELHRQLAAKGHVFQTTCDTEALVHLWEDEGPRMVERLVGMFAFAIWDAKQQTLFLARDRLGIKPLYYAQYGSRFAFASELKAFCEDVEFPRTLRPDALAHYFCMGYILDPLTIFAHAHKLPPGCTMLCRMGQPIPSPSRYWQIRFRCGPARSLEDWMSEYASRLDQTVKEHLLSDVPLGAFLSGGIDSSLIVDSMCRSAGESVRTFSIGFAEDDFDEHVFAEAVARRLKTDHLTRCLEPDVVELLSLLARQYDEPFGDSSSLPTYMVSKLARERVKVVLSGDGGDEVFGGYPRYVATLDRSRLQPYVPSWLARAIEALGRPYPRGWRGRGWLDRRERARAVSREGDRAVGVLVDAFAWRDDLLRLCSI
ncbi:asparagine synthase (glutamine-hydrolyzing), partial [sediment metagenome]